MRRILLGLIVIVAIIAITNWTNAPANNTASTSGVVAIVGGADVVVPAMTPDVGCKTNGHGTIAINSAGDAYYCADNCAEGTTKVPQLICPHDGGSVYFTTSGTSGGAATSNTLTHQIIWEM